MGLDTHAGDTSHAQHLAERVRASGHDVQHTRPQLTRHTPSTKLDVCVQPAVTCVLKKMETQNSERHKPGKQTITKT